jgi:hypothetical protein
MNLRAISLRSFKTNYPLWYALSLAVYLCSFSGMEIVAALFSGGQRWHELFEYDVFTYEFICPVAVSMVAGWLAQCALVMIFSWRRISGADAEHSGGMDVRPVKFARVNYAPLAFLVAIFVEWHLGYRYAWLPYDYRPPDMWYFKNLRLMGLALLPLAPVLRHGSACERMVASALGVWPATAVVGGFYIAYAQLTQS